MNLDEVLANLPDDQLAAIAGGNLEALPDETLGLIAGGQSQEVPPQPESSEGLGDLLGGIPRGGLKLGATVADLVSYPFRRGYAELVDSPPEMKQVFPLSNATEDVLSTVGLPKKDSVSQRVGEFLFPAAPSGLLAQGIAGTGAGLADYYAEKYAPDSTALRIAAPIIGGGLALGASHIASSPVQTFNKAITPFSSKKGGIELAKESLEELRKVVPDALTETITPAQRAQIGAEAISKVLGAQEEALKTQFQNLPDVPINIDDALENIKVFGEANTTPLSAPTTDKIFKAVEEFRKPEQVFRTPAKVIDIPASEIVDELGNPLRPASRQLIPEVVQVIPGEATKVPLNKLQNVLRDVRELRGPGVDEVLSGQAVQELENAVLKNAPRDVADSFIKLRQDYKAFKELSQSPVGKIGDTAEKFAANFNKFKSVIKSNPNAAKEVVKILSPEEISNTQKLLLADVLGKSPSSWSSYINNNIDSFKAVFGDEGASNLLKIFGQQGSLGSELVRSPSLLRNLFGRIGGRAAVNAGVGYAAGGWLGSAVGAVTGLASNALESKKVKYAVELLRSASVGNEDAIKLLTSTPKGPITKSLNALAQSLKSSFKNEETGYFKSLIKKNDEFKTQPTTEIYKNNNQSVMEIGLLPSDKSVNLTKDAIQELPVSKIQLSSDVPQWKKGSNEKGVVKQLEGTFEELGTAPIVVWERENGNLEVISGRHRLDLAKRNNKQTIKSQVVKESEGFSASDARKLDAMLNIRDGHGTIEDFIKYFRESDISIEEARNLNLIRSADAEKGFVIGKFAGPELYTAVQQGALKKDAAFAIAKAAPNDESLQLAGIRAIQNKVDPDDLPNVLEVLKTRSKDLPESEQLGLFGDDKYEKFIAKQASVAESVRQEIKNQIASIKGAQKRPETATKLGLPVNDPKALENKIITMEAELQKFKEWHKYPEIRAILEEWALTKSKPKTAAKEIASLSRKLSLVAPVYFSFSNRKYLEEE